MEAVEDGAGPERRTTIYDVADAAGVSLATVSRVINASAPVSEETRRRVLAAVGRLGFSPSLLASSLTRRRSQTLGLVVPDIGNPFFAELARSAEKTAAVRGYALFVCNTDGHAAQEASYIEALTRRRVDGLLLCTGNPASVRLARRAGLATVSLARDLPPEAQGHGAVLLDDRLGGQMATRYLLGLAHRRIGFVGEGRHIRSSVDRGLGYRQAMVRAGIAAPPAWSVDAVVASERRLQAIVQGMRRDALTAVCVATDAIAWRLMRALRRNGLGVPEDISLVSFDDTAVARLIDPPLTSVRQPIARMGRLAVEMLLAGLGDAAPAPGALRRVLRPRLVVRQSTAPPRPTP